MRSDIKGTSLPPAYEHPSHWSNGAAAALSSEAPTQPKFVYVTQNGHRSEVIKERGLARAVWLRLACGAALGALVLGVVLLAVLAPRAPSPAPDIAPHDWNISRSQWGALQPPPEVSPNEPFDAPFRPLRLVVVQHTAGSECHRLVDCTAVMRTLQHYFYTEMRYDVPYNFVVGNDGRVYEARGWGHVCAPTRLYNRCALSLGFTGDYRTAEGSARVSAAQLDSMELLLAGGVRDGLLHERYVLLAASDVQSTLSPGDNLHDALRDLPHYATHPEAFRSRDCSEVYAEFEAEDAAADPVVDFMGAEY